MDDKPSAVTSLMKRPYWRVVIRLGEYDGSRIIEVAKCMDVLESTAVRAGGWRYPFVSRDHDRFSIGPNYAQSWIEQADFLEFSRLYQSGQFVYATALRESFLPADNEQLKEARELAKSNDISVDSYPTGVVNIVRFMRLATVAFINCQRLIDALGYEGAVTMNFRLANVKGAVLVAGFERDLDEYYQANETILDHDIVMPSNDIRTNPDSCGLLVAKHFFARFRWIDPDDFVLRGLQEEALA